MERYSSVMMGVSDPLKFFFTTLLLSDKRNLASSLDEYNIDVNLGAGNLVASLSPPSLNATFSCVILTSLNVLTKILVAQKVVVYLRKRGDSLSTIYLLAYRLAFEGLAQMIW